MDARSDRPGEHFGPVREARTSADVTDRMRDGHYGCRTLEARGYAPTFVQAGSGRVAMASIDTSNPRGSLTLAGADRAGGGIGMCWA